MDTLRAIIIATIAAKVTVPPAIPIAFLFFENQLRILEKFFPNLRSATEALEPLLLLVSAASADGPTIEPNVKKDNDVAKVF